jgi:hypothetical protein
MRKWKALAEVFVCNAIIALMNAKSGLNNASPCGSIASGLTLEGN